MSVLPIEGLNKLCVLPNYVTPKIYESFAECATYDEAIQTLEALFVKPTNEIFARHFLATRCQHAGETLDEYLQALKTFKAKIYAISSDTHQLQFLKLHRFKLERI